jgi:hypothetical protein
LRVFSAWFSSELFVFLALGFLRRRWFLAHAFLRREMVFFCRSQLWQSAHGFLLCAPFSTLFSACVFFDIVFFWRLVSSALFVLFLRLFVFAAGCFCEVIGLLRTLSATSYY